MEAMIFAAGLGSRLKPITDKIPKALVMAGGKTLLQHNIEHLVSCGVTHIVINVHHFADQIAGYLLANNNFGVNIEISGEQNLLLDTGGGLKHASLLLKGGNPIILQNADVYSDINYSDMLKFHKESSSLATLAVRDRKSSRYLLFDEHGSLCGWQNINSGDKIIRRKGVQYQSLAFSGIQIIEPELLAMLPKKKVFGIIEVYLNLCKTSSISGYLHNGDTWFDVGSLEKLNKLEHFLAKKRPR